MDIRRKMDQYANKVLKPKLEENLKVDNDKEKIILDLQNKQIKSLTSQNSTKRRLITSHYKDVNNQIKQSEFRKSIDKNLYDYDKEDMNQKVTTSLDFDQMARQEKERKKQMYKDILNYQWQLNKKLRSQGGMTKTELEMNKGHLKKLYKLW